MKKVEYTSHARKQMKDRGIFKWEVRFCLENHDVTYTDVGGNPIYVGRPGGRRIKVVIKKDSIDPIIIITAADLKIKEAIMKLEYDKQADAVYIYFSDTDYAYGKDLDHERRVDYSADGKPRGVELTCVSHGVNIDDLPFAGEVEKLLRDENIRIFA